MNEEFDVIIIGGGPAGLSAGIVCARNGLKTLLCEKKTYPIDKTCGEGIMPTGLANLENLGVTPFLKKEQYYPFKGIHYVSPKGKVAESSFAEGNGWGVRRLELSSAFLKRAQQFELLEILENTKIELNRNQTDDPIVVINGKSYHPKLLIGADGLHSKIRHWAGLNKPKRNITRWGVRQHFEIEPFSSFVEVHWKKGIEAYLTPTSETTIDLAFLWNNKQWKNLKKGKQLYPSLLSHFPELSKKIRNARPLDQARAIGPLQQNSSSPISKKLLLMGDAAGYLDAITGEGISLATEQALLLEKHIIPLLLKDIPINKQNLTNYIQAYEKIMKAYHQVTGMVLQLSKYPWLVEKVVACLGKEPDIFQHMLSANMGLVSPFALNKKQILRFGFCLLIK